MSSNKQYFGRNSLFSNTRIILNVGTVRHVATQVNDFIWTDIENVAEAAINSFLCTLFVHRARDKLKVHVHEIKSIFAIVLRSLLWI